MVRVAPSQTTLRDIVITGPHQAYEERRCESSAQAVTERERSRKGRDRQQGHGKVICRVRRTGSWKSDMLRLTMRRVELLNIFVRSNLLKSRGTGHDVYLPG